MELQSFVATLITNLREFRGHFALTILFKRGKARARAGRRFRGWFLSRVAQASLSNAALITNSFTWSK